MPGEASLHTDKPVLDLLTEGFHVPLFPQPSIPFSSFRLGYSWQHLFSSIVRRKVGHRYEEEVADGDIPSPERQVQRCLCLVGDAFLTAGGKALPANI